MTVRLPRGSFSWPHADGAAVGCLPRVLGCCSAPDASSLRSASSAVPTSSVADDVRYAVTQLPWYRWAPPVNLAYDLLFDEPPEPDKVQNALNTIALITSLLLSIIMAQVPTSLTYDELQAANARYDTTPAGASWRSPGRHEWGRAGLLHDTMGGLYSNRLLFYHLNACGYLVCALLSCILTYFFFLTGDFSGRTPDYEAWYSVARWLLLAQFACFGLGIFSCFFLLDAVVDIKFPDACPDAMLAGATPMAVQLPWTPLLCSHNWFSDMMYYILVRPPALRDCDPRASSDSPAACCAVVHHRLDGCHGVARAGAPGRVAAPHLQRRAHAVPLRALRVARVRGAPLLAAPQQLSQHRADGARRRSPVRVRGDTHGERARRAVCAKSARLCNRQRVNVWCD